MKYTGEKSLSSFLAKFLNVVFYFSIFLMVITLPIFFFLYNSNKSFTALNLGSISLKASSGNLSLNFLAFLFFIPDLIISLIFIKKMANIFSILSKDRIFDVMIFSNLKFISILVLLLSFIDPLMQFFCFMNLFDSSKLSPIQFTINYSIVNPLFLLIGLSLLVFSEIYKNALKLKEDSDLTI